MGHYDEYYEAEDAARRKEAERERERAEERAIDRWDELQAKSAARKKKKAQKVNPTGPAS